MSTQVIKTLKYLGLLNIMILLSLLIVCSHSPRANPVHLPSWQSVPKRPRLIPKSKLLDQLPSGPVIRSSLSHELSRATLFESRTLRNLLRVRAPYRRNGLMIVGDSLSATDRFIRCMTKFNPSLTKWTSITHAWSIRGPFSVLQRESYSAQHGATTWELLKPSLLKPKGGYGYKRSHINLSNPSPSEPLLKEIYHNQARYASVLLGTNDLYYRKGLERFAWRYIQLIESLLSAGILPIVQTLPPQTSPLLKDRSLLHTFNHAIRAIAYAERVPLLNLYTPLSSLTHQGLREDGIHLNAYAGGCRLDAKGLRFGHNLRNELFLSAYSTIHNEDKESSQLMNPKLKTSLSSVIISKVKPNSTIFTHGHACWRQSMVLANKALRWRRLHRGYKERRSDFIGPPLESYGTWRMQSTPIIMQKQSMKEILSFLSPGIKRDVSREQAWLQTANGRCIHLGRNTRHIRLVSGKHQFIHLTRLKPITTHQRDSSTGQPYGRALVSW